MATGTLSRSPPTGSSPEHDHLHHLVREACQPVAQFWPMSRFVHHNPIHGLEHLPFDQAVREAHHLLGGNGYLSNEEYRQAYRGGRIAPGSVDRALRRVGPAVTGTLHGGAGADRIGPVDLWRAHLLFGFPPLEPMLLTWTLGVGGVVEPQLRRLWESALEAVRTLPPPELERGAVELPAKRTVGDWIDTLAGASVVEEVNAQVIKWVAAFVDEGMAGWTMPSRDRGLYPVWRDLAPRDLSARLRGIAGVGDKVRALPATPEDAVLAILRRLGVPEERWKEYLSRHLAQLPGWAGLLRWLGENPDYPGQAGHPVDPIAYLAIRLFYEAELADAVCRHTWGVAGSVPGITGYWRDRVDQHGRLPSLHGHGHDVDVETRVACERAWPLFRVARHFELTPDTVRQLSAGDVETVLGWLAAFPEDRHGPVWLEAYEDTYRQALLRQLAEGRDVAPGAPARPRAQIVLCIDVRSESFRRHIEAQGGLETFGYAGFFGVAMNHEAFDSHERFPLCPVLLKPRHAVDEVVRPDQRLELQSYASGTRWQRLGDHMFHDLKQSPLASPMLVDALGWFFSIGLVGRTLAPAVYGRAVKTVHSWFEPPVATRIGVEKSEPSAEPGGGDMGFTFEEQAAMVEGGLRAIGLTENFARLVVLCGHGSVTENNPYFGALHCGACGGKHGDANARAFAAMANHTRVRELLGAKGVQVPQDTWFVGAKHLTTSDRVEFYDVGYLPESHREDLRALQADLRKAGAAQALERCGRMPGARRDGSPDLAFQHVAARTVDWANVRPEWGLSGNAAFVIARRSLTRRVNLNGRAFLHSYDPDSDPEGAILERIMTAPLIVGQWINMEHYFSAVDPWFWGSGSKVIHNVVSGVGVMLGSQSDLQTGLPLQTVNNGAAHYHEPMRLLTVIEAPPARISSVILKHALLQELLHNQWLNLVAVDPAGFTFHRYAAEGVWEPLS